MPTTSSAFSHRVLASASPPGWRELAAVEPALHRDGLRGLRLVRVPRRLRRRRLGQRQPLLPPSRARVLGRGRQLSDPQQAGRCRLRVAHLRRARSAHGPAPCARGPARGLPLRRLLRLSADGGPRDDAGTGRGGAAAGLPLLRLDPALGHGQPDQSLHRALPRRDGDRDRRTATVRAGGDTPRCCNPGSRLHPCRDRRRRVRDRRPGGAALRLSLPLDRSQGRGLAMAHGRDPHWSWS